MANDEIKALEERIKVLEEGENIDTKVLAERVKNHKEISDRTFLSNRNFGIFTILVLTFIGAPAIYYSIGALVKHTARKRFDEVLNKQYIEKEIRTRSEITINKLMNEVEVRAKNIMDQYSTYQDWKLRGDEAAATQDPKKAVICYKKAIIKLKEFVPYSYDDKGEVVYLHFNLIEEQIIIGDYEEALLSIKDVYPYITRLNERGAYAIMYFLECIVKKILDSNYLDAENKLHESLKEAFYVEWQFDFIETWLKEVDVTEDSKAYILNKIELFKKSMR